MIGDAEQRECACVSIWLHISLIVVVLIFLLVFSQINVFVNNNCDKLPVVKRENTLFSDRRLSSLHNNNNNNIIVIGLRHGADL